jgi:hypothetical protein
MNVGLESALTPNSDSGFLVPLKNSKMILGRYYSFGKEKFMLEVLVNNKSIKKINIKIKKMIYITTDTVNLEVIA